MEKGAIATIPLLNFSVLSQGPESHPVERSVLHATKSKLRGGRWSTPGRLGPGTYMCMPGDQVWYGWLQKGGMQERAFLFPVFLCTCGLNPFPQGHIIHLRDRPGPKDKSSQIHGINGSTSQCITQGQMQHMYGSPEREGRVGCGFLCHDARVSKGRRN